MGRSNRRYRGKRVGGCHSVWLWRPGGTRRGSRMLVLGCRLAETMTKRNRARAERESRRFLAGRRRRGRKLKVESTGKAPLLGRSLQKDGGRLDRGVSSNRVRVRMGRERVRRRWAFDARHVEGDLGVVARSRFRFIDTRQRGEDVVRRSRGWRAIRREILGKRWDRWNLCIFKNVSIRGQVSSSVLEESWIARVAVGDIAAGAVAPGFPRGLSARSCRD